MNIVEPPIRRVYDVDAHANTHERKEKIQKKNQTGVNELALEIFHGQRRRYSINKTQL